MTAEPEPQTDLEAMLAEQMGADEAEPEPEPEPEPEGEPEPEPEPEPEGVMSEADIEAIGKKLDNVSRYVARKMGEILGEDAQHFDLCEVCTFSNTPGFRPSGPYPPEVVAAVMHALGQRSRDTLKKDPHSDTCPECGGEGDVATGSRVPQWEDIPCAKCRGRGWIPTDEVRSETPLSIPNGSSPAEPLPAGATRPMEPGPVNLPPEAQRLREQGYIIVPPAVPA